MPPTAVVFSRRCTLNWVIHPIQKKNAMSTAHVEKFLELVGKDPALLAKLGLDKVNPDAGAASVSAAGFMANFFKEAKALGLEITEEEARAFMHAELKAAASGELTDMTLEAVVGGGREVAAAAGADERAVGKASADERAVGKYGKDLDFSQVHLDLTLRLMKLKNK